LADKATPTAFLSVHFLLAVQKKVNMGFLFLIAEKESKKVFPRPCSGYAFLVTFSLLLETKKK